MLNYIVGVLVTFLGMYWGFFMMAYLCQPKKDLLDQPTKFALILTLELAGMTVAMILPLLGLGILFTQPL